VLQKLAVQKF